MSSPEMSSFSGRNSHDVYLFKDLPTSTSFRIIELLPGGDTEPIHCRLHVVAWNEPPPHYEAISYAWGDPDDKASIVCEGKQINITKSLHAALTHFRLREQSRMLWADALCINQEDLLERGLQVKQMKKIYEQAQKVQVWIGPDNEAQQAEMAVHAIKTISDFLCEKLNIDIAKHDTQEETYQELLLKSKDKLPEPDETHFSSDSLWKSLVWFYSHKYFTRVWAIQEVSANAKREINVGYSKTIWARLDLTASYIIMEPTFADKYGFANAYCWWVATIAELTIQPKRWINMLYLASNYGCLDERDVIYGLRGLMKLAEGESLLEPDYNKCTQEVYRDSVEAALVDFKKTDVLCYVTGSETPSWIPRWNVPMLFRNPFRFGKPMPWKPAGESKAAWSMDKPANILTLSGFSVESIQAAETYNQLWFANSAIDTSEERLSLQRSWTKILRSLGATHGSLPLPESFIGAMAASLSFGLNHRLGASEQHDLSRYFVAYLNLVLSNDVPTLTKYVPPHLIHESKSFDGRKFGKPVWDFQYPDASIFVLDDGLVGCAIAPTQTGDIVFVAHGSTYPLVLRPSKDKGRVNFTIRGFAYVHGIMDGERAPSKSIQVDIR